jgi:hypothetical protein
MDDPNEYGSTGTVAAPAPPAHQNGHVALTRDAILAARDLRTEWVDVPEWGGGVFVRGLTAGQRDRLEASLIDRQGKPAPQRLGEFRSRMLAACVVDGAGAPVFAERDVAALMNKSMLAVGRVLEVARRLSGMTEADEADAVGESAPAP